MQICVLTYSRISERIVPLIPMASQQMGPYFLNPLGLKSREHNHKTYEVYSSISICNYICCMHADVNRDVERSRNSNLGPGTVGIHITTGSHSGAWLGTCAVYKLYMHLAPWLGSISLSLSFSAYALGYLAGYMDSLYIYLISIYINCAFYIYIYIKCTIYI